MKLVLAARLGALLCLLSAQGVAQAQQEQLLSGVRLFRAARYEDALATFQRAAAQQAQPEIGFYVGTTLHKLGRHEEALRAFRAAQQAGLREPIADYYQAVSCFRLGMLERARHQFSAFVALGKEGGPRLQEGGARFLRAIATDAAAPQQRYQEALRRAESEAPDSLEWAEEALRLSRVLPGAAREDARLRARLQRPDAALLRGTAADLVAVMDCLLQPRCAAPSLR